MTAAPVTTETPKPKSKLSNGIRSSLGFFIALSLGLFILLWDGQYIPHGPFPGWVGGFIFIPLLAITLGVCVNILVQQLSCGFIQWGAQVNRIMYIPISFIIMRGVLNFIPGLRWPIEGLVQDLGTHLKMGLSSGFYTFWIGLYTQSLMSGASQMCPT